MIDPAHVTATGSIDEAALGRIANSGTMTEVVSARATLVNTKTRVEQQLRDSKAMVQTERARLLTQTNMHAREADLRAQAESDAEWRSRALAFSRRVDRWITQMNARISVLSNGMCDRHAFVIAGVAKSAELAARALNEVMSRGAIVFQFAIIGHDLIVVAKETTPQ